MDPYLPCARILNTHGFRGTVKAECLCDSVEVLKSLETVYTREGAEMRPHRVVRVSAFKALALIDLEDVTTMEGAEALKNTELFARREDLPLSRDRYFESDAIGLKVIDLDSGKTYGVITGIVNRGAQDLYVVKGGRGESLLPAVPQFIARVVPDEAVYVTPIPGLLEEEPDA